MWTFLLLLVLGSVLAPSLNAAPPLTKEECHAIVKDLEQLSNMNPGEVEARAPQALAKLRNGETLPSYFIAYNIYVENLFNKGKVDKARSEIAKMVGEAFDRSDPECRVVALRAQGQFYYKLGLFPRAADSFRKAMDICPRYDSDRLENCFTWSSTLFWLVQADIHAGNLDEAQNRLAQVDDMMNWLDAKGEPDAVGYKPVMIRGLKAKIALQRGDIPLARSLLAECPKFIRSDIPARAYVEYYVAKMGLLVKEGRHQEAIPILDRLIEMHSDDYKPIAAEFIYQKGLSLAQLGRFQESTQALQDYVRLKGEVDQLALAQQLDELTTRYEVEKLRHEHDVLRKRLVIVLVVCLALIVVTTLIIISRKRLQRKNKALARNISELNKLSREVVPASEPNDAETPVSPVDDELLATGNKIVDYINRSKCYLRSDCSRDTIKEGVGVSEHTLAKAVVAATGLSFVNYINRLRLDVSVGLLEDHPEMTVADIANACGFGTVRQFQRIFKQRFDLTPTAYRAARRSS